MKATELRSFRTCILAALLVINTGCSSPTVVKPRDDSHASAAVEVPKQIVALGEYRLEVYPQTESKPSRFMFIKGGKVVYAGRVDNSSQLTVVFMKPADASEDAGQVEGYNPDSEVVETAQEIEAKDADIHKLTHDSEPVVMLENNTGGSYEYSLFRLGTAVEKFATIKNGRYQVKLKRLDSDTAPSHGKTASEDTRIYTNDIYADWGARSVMPEIVLRLDHGNFVPDAECMRKPAPDLDELNGLKSAIREEFVKYSHNGGIYSAPPELSDELLQLCYTGHAKLAREFLDRCWPRRTGGKSTYWAALVKKMHSSKYWSTVRELNGTYQI